MDIKDGWIAYLYSETRGIDAINGNLWIGQLRKNTHFQSVRNKIVDFRLLDRGRCVYVTTSTDPKDRTATGFFSDNKSKKKAFYLDANTKCAWNVLSGVKSMEHSTNEKYIIDKTSVRLICGIGSSRYPSSIICLFSHDHADPRPLVEPPAKYLPWQTWRRTILVTSDGQRYETSILRDWQSPTNRVWLHNSGRVVIGIGEWTKQNTRDVFQTKLSVLKLSMKSK